MRLILKVSLIIFTLLVSFSSCRKNGHGFVRGTVYEKGTNKPLPGVPIKITYSWHNNSGYYYQYDTTDANGEYRINLKKKRGYAYHIQAKNHVDDEYESIDYKKSAINFSVYAEAYLKINAKKTSNSTNRLGVTVDGLSASSSSVSGPYEDILDVVIPWDQLPIVYKPHFFVKGNVPTKVSWQVYNGNTPVGTGYDTIITINSGETFTHTIVFN